MSVQGARLVDAAALIEEAKRISAEVAAPAADNVDRESRFPIEAITALREAGLLGAMVPADLGGFGATTREIAEMTRVLAHGCGSTAMIFAMHQIEVASLLVEADPSPWLQDFIRRLASEQLLLANGSSEVGLGGANASLCAVETTADGFHLEKHCSAISYGAYADCIVATARRTPESEGFDEVTVLCVKPSVTLEPSGTWDTIGLRGTCSNSFRLVADGPSEQILPAYTTVIARVGQPIAHILRGYVWLGLAETAATKAHHVVVRQAKKEIGTLPPAATRLAELIIPLQQMRDTLSEATRDFDDALNTPTADSLAYLTRMEALKASVSNMLLEVVGRAVVICGINGYRQDSPESLSRVLRDAYASPVMINNDRTLRHNALRLIGRKEI
jgi:acyl-CoA dehydrogenase